MKRHVDISALGTRSWRSYALFRAGIAAAAAADHQSAEDLYIEALRDDPGNLAARVNLAGELMLERREGEGPNIEFAIVQLQQVLKKFEENATQNDETILDDAVYYSALYQLTAASYDAGRFEAALEYARRLDIAISWATVESEELRPWDSPSERDERLMAYSDQTLPATRAMLIGIEVEGGLAELDELRRRVDGSLPSAQLQYNYACALAVASRRERDAGEIIVEALQRLQFAFRMRDSLRLRARADKSLDNLRDHPKFKAMIAPPGPTPPAAPPVDSPEVPLVPPVA